MFYSSGRVSRKVAARFRDALIGQRLTLPLSLLITMQKNKEIYNVSDSKHIKLVGTMYDMCHDTLVQFGSYMAHLLTPSDFRRQMPSVAELVSDYHLPGEIALYLLRPLFFQAVQSQIESEPKAEGKQSDSADTTSSESDESTTRMKKRFYEIFDETTKPVVRVLTPVLTDITEISVRFFALFWTLSPYDLYVPRDAYDSLIQRLEDNLRQDDGKSSHDYSSKRRKERDKVRDTIGTLRSERMRQKVHVERVLYCLDKQGRENLSSPLGVGAVENCECVH